MMYQKKSGKASRFKALALVPACALALSVTAIPSVKAAITTIDESSVTTDKGSKKSADGKTMGSNLDEIRVIGYGMEKKSDNGLVGQTKDVSGINSLKLNGEDVDNSDVTIILDGKEITEEQMQKLDPHDINDITVNKDKGIIIINTRKSLGEMVESPDVLPKYKGGMEDIYRELAMNLRYPMDAAQKGITGKTVVEFIILADGTLTGSRILQTSGNEDLDIEAIRAVNTLKEGWTPGMNDGKPVNCTFALPVNFSLKKD